MSYSSVKQYAAVLILQYLLLLYDINVNAYITLAHDQPVDMLILYIVQDLCQIVSLTILLASFLSTYLFQVGLIQLLYSRFRLTLVLCVVYLVLSIVLHAWHVNILWSSSVIRPWSKGFHVLYSLHRAVAAIYYYFYKRAALRISDPRFYEGSSWVQKQLSLP